MSDAELCFPLSRREVERLLVLVSRLGLTGIEPFLSCMNLTIMLNTHFISCDRVCLMTRLFLLLISLRLLIGGRLLRSVYVTTRKSLVLLMTR